MNNTASFDGNKKIMSTETVSLKNIRDTLVVKIKNTSNFTNSVHHQPPVIRIRILKEIETLIKR